MIRRGGLKQVTSYGNLTGSPVDARERVRGPDPQRRVSQAIQHQPINVPEHNFGENYRNK